MTDQEHMELHDKIFKSLQEIERQVGLLISNGGVTLTIKDKRIKFAGSIPTPKPLWIIIVLAAMGGNIGWLTKLFGAW